MKKIITKAKEMFLSNRISAFWQFLVVSFFLFVPSIVFGQLTIIPEDFCDGPTCTFDDFLTLMKNVFNFVISFAIIISSIAFAYAGYLYITSGGDSGKTKQATSIFTNFAVGLFFLLAAFLIIQLILDSLGIDSGSVFRRGII